MKNTNKAFTLVELIVVITILAILGTIAFVSLQGYTQDAKNSKVTSDLRTMVTAIEVGTTKGTLSLSNLVDSGSTNKVDSSKTITFESGAEADGTPKYITGAISSVSYKVGTIDFQALRQNGDDFKDSDGHDYLAAYAGKNNTAYYQLAGQTKNADGSFTAVVKGNYVSQNSTDALGLVADKQSTSPYNVGIKNKQNLAENHNLYK